MIKQKCFVFGFAILLLVSLFLIGCNTTPKTETTTTSTTVSSVAPESTKTTETTTTTTTVSSSTKASSSTEVSSVSEGKSLVEKKCTVCHNTERIYLKKRDAAEWGTIVNKMIGKGAAVNDAERTKIIGYLASLNQ